MTEINWAADSLYQPFYSFAEVSRYTHVPLGTLRFWTRSKEGRILVPAGQDPAAPLSFMNLVESHVLRALRRTHRVPMQRIRRAVEWLREQYETDHPLAELDLETDGYDVFIREAQFPVSAMRKGQMGIPDVLSRYLERIERDSNNIPIRFFPMTNEASPKVIVMDPTIAYGRPVIKGTRITTLMVYARYTGGEGLADIAADYGLEIAEIEEALRCELEQEAA